MKGKVRSECICSCRLRGSKATPPRLKMFKGLWLQEASPVSCTLSVWCTHSLAHTLSDTHKNTQLLCVCVFVCKCVYVHVHAHACVFVCVCACVCVCVRERESVCVRVYVFEREGVFVRVCVCVSRVAGLE